MRLMKRVYDYSSPDTYANVLARGVEMFTAEYPSETSGSRVWCIGCQLKSGAVEDRFFSYADVLRHLRAHQKAGHIVTERDIKRVKKYRRYIEGMLRGVSRDAMREQGSEREDRW